MAFREGLSISETFVYSRTTESAAALAEHATSLRMDAAVVARPEDALGEATLMVTAATGREPVLHEGYETTPSWRRWAFKPEAAELPPALIYRSTVAADATEGGRE
jgi:ornithine cyclodeaminase